MFCILPSPTSKFQCPCPICLLLSPPWSFFDINLGCLLRLSIRRLFVPQNSITFGWLCRQCYQSFADQHADLSQRPFRNSQRFRYGRIRRESLAADTAVYLLTFSPYMSVEPHCQYACGRAAFASSLEMGGEEFIGGSTQLMTSSVDFWCSVIVVNVCS